MIRPPLSLRELGRWLPFWAAFAAALVLRLWSLGERPLSHDEAINAAFLARLAEGLPYIYNPGNFHGPLLYYAGVWPLRLLGASETALRLPLALVSACMIPLLLPLRTRLGVAGVTGAAWLLAVSPSLAITGRTLIHETWLGFFTLACVGAASRWLETRRGGALLLACGSAGLMLTVKETSLLTLATLVGAAGLATVVCAGSWRPARPRLRTLLVSGAALVIPPLLLFTSFLSHPQGLLDALRGPLLWSKVGVSGAGHAKPWVYFLRLLAGLETVSLVGAGLGGWLAVRRRDLFGVFCAAWTAGQLLLYSAIPYKTPWLAINIVIPAALTAGIAIRETVAWRGRRLVAGLGVLVLAVGWSGWQAADAALSRYDDPRSIHSYAQSRREVHSLVAAVRAAVEKTPGGKLATVDVIVLHPWPLPWYFRDLPGIRWRHEVPPQPDGDVLIVEGGWEKILRPRLRGSYVRRVYPFRPGGSLVVYCRPPLSCFSRLPGGGFEHLESGDG
jgi:uncharacterized protein (TIGR03663 family)